MGIFGKKTELNEISLDVEGMMCSHCEKAVTDALKKVSGVKEVVASASDRKVTVKAAPGVSVESIKSVITDLGYKVS